MILLPHLLWALPALGQTTRPAIERKRVVQAFNPIRHASNPDTPLQVGNGDFAFGADITGLQTFRPFSTMSTWGWHNFSLPSTPNQTTIQDFTGLDWWTHGRLVNYNQPNPAQNDISNWLRENPHRLNLGTLGLSFGGASVDESALSNATQQLDMWSGGLVSQFVYNGSNVEVDTWVDPDSDTIAVRLASTLLATGGLGLFLDFPYPTKDKFNAPYVGVFNATDKHVTILRESVSGKATIEHALGETRYLVQLRWEGGGELKKPMSGSHRHVLHFTGSEEIKLTATFSASGVAEIPSYDKAVTASKGHWPAYWSTGAFIDLTKVKSDDAIELQRRTIQSQYLVAVNCLVNNGWYGKFHMEMYLWHVLHWARWNHWSIFSFSTPGTYDLFLPGAFALAEKQGYSGARWGKMMDPSGGDAPGEINSLLIWQQPHPMYFAETEYRAFPTAETLKKWDALLSASADFMVSFAWLNASTGRYDLGPPMYPASENTAPNATRNPTFELAYWRFGLEVASTWKTRQGKNAPKEWTDVLERLAPLPIVEGTFPVYEGIPGMWTNNATTMDHPAMTAVYGLLPPPKTGLPLNLTVVADTAAMVHETWDLDQSFGWDFPMLAMNALRLGDASRAVEYLLHPTFQFDDAGYPIGGTRVPTPYFPSSSSLLLAIAMMAGGWDGAEGVHFPPEWEGAVAEGFVAGL